MTNHWIDEKKNRDRIDAFAITYLIRMAKAGRIVLTPVQKAFIRQSQIEWNKQEHVEDS